MQIKCSVDLKFNQGGLEGEMAGWITRLCSKVDFFVREYAGDLVTKLCYFVQRLQRKVCCLPLYFFGTLGHGLFIGFTRFYFIRVAMNAN